MMNNIKEIKLEAWNKAGWPKNLAVISLYPDDLSCKFGIESFEYEEDGLGKCIAFMFEIDGTKYFSQSFPDGPKEAQFINISVQSTEYDSKQALTKIIKALEITDNELVWVNEELGIAKWLLTRLDDNGNEVEMFRFQEKGCAEAVRNQYENRGHKQTYVVKNAT